MRGPALSIIGLVMVLAQARPAPALPVCDGFDFPFNPPDGGNGWWLAQKKGEHNPRFGGYHTGEDWNWGSGSEDIGKPIFSVANGVVVLAAWCGEGWRDVVVIHHRLRDGSEVESKYAHLQNLKVRSGKVVWRGQQVGEIGPAPAGSTAPHLHWEIRKVAGAACGAAYTSRADCARRWYEPSAFVASHRPAGHRGRAPAAATSDEGLVRRLGRWPRRHPLKARFALGAFLVAGVVAGVAHLRRTRHHAQSDEGLREGEQSNEC